MNTFMMLAKISVIFMLQLMGTLMVSDGLRMIWPPLSPVFNGVILIFIGHRLYLQLESEEVKK